MNMNDEQRKNFEKFFNEEMMNPGTLDFSAMAKLAYQMFSSFAAAGFKEEYAMELTKLFLTNAWLASMADRGGKGD